MTTSVSRRPLAPAVAAGGRPPRRGLTRRRVVWGLALVAGPLLALLGFDGYVQARTVGAIYALDAPTLPHHHAALVFGAGLTRDGGPSAILYDRVATAVDLYQAHKVEKLLMSGDGSQEDYNEVAAMRRTAVALGVPTGDIVLDYAGFRTYDSCYRARAVFGLDSATLVTNAYHLPRALYTCMSLGLEVAGVASDRRPYPTFLYRVREIPALAATRWWLFTARPPHFLGPPVDIDAPQAP